MGVFRFLLFFATVFVFNISIAQAQANGRCPVFTGVVDVDVRVRADEVQVNNTRSIHDLRREPIDSNSRLRKTANYQVSGLTKGNINVEREVEFRTSVEQNSGVSCIWPIRITVDVHLIDTVYIANQYSPGSCEFRETYNHEIKHVNVDRTVLNKYVPYIKSRIQMTANMLGVQGPVSDKELPRLRKNMSEKIRLEVDNIIDQLQNERSRRQNDVDTESEYERVSRSCRNW